ncbi:hypothetical protein D3C80_1769210 [compost metagenome]
MSVSGFGVPKMASSRFRLKPSLTDSPPESAAVTTISIAPARVPAGGVPLKVRLAASKLSQAGKASPPANVALSIRLSPTSTSAKVLTGRL